MEKLSELLRYKYKSNLIWTFTEKFLSLLSVLVIGVLLARYLGPEKFGLLSYSQSFVAMFSFLIGLGLDAIIVREIVKNPQKSSVIVSTSFLMKLLAFFIVALLINLLSIRSNDSFEIKLIILIISLNLLKEPFNVFASYFQAIVKIQKISFVIIISKLALIILKLLLIYSKFSLIYFVIVDSVVLILAAIFYFILYVKHKNISIKDTFKFDRKISNKLLLDSWPLMISSGAIMLYMRFDQIMIKKMISLEELGFYSVSVKIAESWYFIPMLISSVMYPLLIEAKKSNDLYMHRLKQLFFSCIMVSLLCSVLLFIFSDFIIEILFGELFSGSKTTLSILSIGGIFVGMGYVNGKWMVIENFTKLSLIRNILGLFINVSLNFYLIPKYGIIGAAVSTLISLAFASYFFFLIIKRTREIFYIQTKSIFYLTFKNSK